MVAIQQAILNGGVAWQTETLHVNNTLYLVGLPTGYKYNSSPNETYLEVVGDVFRALALSLRHVIDGTEDEIEWKDDREEKDKENPDKDLNKSAKQSPETLWTTAGVIVPHVADQKSRCSHIRKRLRQ